METILIVDDNQDMNFLLSNILNDEGYQVISARDGHSALREAGRQSIDLVLLDMRLPGMNGMEILKELKNLSAEMQIIMITAYADVNDAVNAMKLGAYDYVTKPFSNYELLLTIKKALENISLSKEVKNLKIQLGQKDMSVDRMGTSPAIQRIIEQAHLIADTNMSVILQGKSGTGKEVIARLIHQFSNRKNKPFVAIDCGAIPENLVESELFGYERGAFTGANNTKIGKFEEGNGGTLLLDEITNLPLEGQAKLLRAIENRQIVRVGGKKQIEVDVRLIVTTNLNFYQEMKRGAFREDLYHRLNEFQILLPTLQERKQDIEILSREFLLEANLQLDKRISGFTPEALTQMQNYNWPGNIRELKYTIKRAVLMANNGVIEPHHLAFVQHDRDDSRFETEAWEEGLSFGEMISRFEKKIISNAITKCHNNKTKAAKMLQLNRKTLYRKMSELKIDL